MKLDHRALECPSCVFHAAFQIAQPRFRPPPQIMMRAIALFLAVYTVNAAASARWADSTDGVHTFLTFDSHIDPANITTETMQPAIILQPRIAAHTGLDSLAASCCSHANRDGFSRRSLRYFLAGMWTSCGATARHVSA